VSPLRVKRVHIQQKMHAKYKIYCRFKAGCLFLKRIYSFFQLVITYPTTFLSFPTTTLSCVNVTVDADCILCSATSLSSERGCMLNSSDGLSITYCSLAEDGNRPQVTSCYQGTFSTTNYSSFTTDLCTQASEFCKVIIIII